MILKLLTAVFFNALVWMFIVPIWHTPDEQSHFGQVAFMAQTGRVARDFEYDLTEEIYQSEVLLGTARDKFGNNKFTFHPEYRIDYTPSLVGIHEPYINSLTNARELVKSESTRYPPLYYAPSAVLYRIFAHENLFVRVFIVRLWSLILFILNVFVVIKLGKLIFSPTSIYPFILGILVGFHPMMVFANIGVTSDTLGNLLFTLFLYLGTAIIVRGVFLGRVIALSTTIALSLYAKPQFIVMVPLLVVVSVLYILPQLSRQNARKSGKSIIFLSIAIVVVLIALRKGPASIFVHTLNNFDIGSFLKFTREYTLSHTLREVLPWYWGVYDWLGVTYPRIVHRVINRVLIVSLAGFVFWLIHVARQKLIIQKRVLGVGFLVIASIMFYAGIALFDWFLWFTSTYPLGVQGRYLFPTVSAHMVIVAIGAGFIVPKIFRFRSLLISLVPTFMILLNMIALITVVSTYYDTSSFSSLVTQASQYKPWFSKGPYLVAVFSASIVSTIIFVLLPLFRSLRNARSWKV